MYCSDVFFLQRCSYLGTVVNFKIWHVHNGTKLSFRKKNFNWAVLRCRRKLISNRPILKGLSSLFLIATQEDAEFSCKQVLYSRSNLISLNKYCAGLTLACEVLASTENLRRLYFNHNSMWIWE